LYCLPNGAFRENVIEPAAGSAREARRSAIAGENNKTKQKMRSTVQMSPPGSWVTWYNHCIDLTIREPLAAWEIVYDDEEAEERYRSTVYPMTFDTAFDGDGSIRRLHLPQRPDKPGSSAVICYEFPGCAEPFPVNCDPYSCRDGEFYRVGKGYIDPTKKNQRSDQSEDPTNLAPE
jgi:hypothetical protein